jgi:hypothetical protein
MVARRTLGARGRVVAAAASIALLGGLAAVMAATDGSKPRQHAPSAPSTPLAHTSTGGR